jgi:uncharacterized protein (DUF952 family)
MPAPTPLPTHLYKILPTAPPTPLPTRLPLSDLDHNDGFIHLSTSSQFSGTASKFFASSAELYLLRIPYDKLASGVDGDGAEGKGEVKWEEVGRGCFAHYYGADLGRANVDAVLRVVREGGEEGEEAWVKAFENAREV